MVYSFTGYNNIYGSRHLSDYSSQDFSIARIIRQIRLFFMVITLLMKILSIICHVPSSLFSYFFVVFVLFVPILVCLSIIKKYKNTGTLMTEVNSFS